MKLRAVFGLWVFLLASAACAQQLAKPLLLAASPTLRGVYSQTALVALPLGDRHFGFIVNRATKVTLASLFPEHAPSAKVLDPVYFGGPVMAQTIFAVVPRRTGPQALHLFGELFMVAQSNAIDRIIEQTPNEARYFAGLVAWQPGELAGEIERGWWYVAEPEPEIFFRRDTSGLWTELVKRLGNGLPPPRGSRLRSVRHFGAGATLRLAAMRSPSPAR